MRLRRIDALELKMLYLVEAGVIVTQVLGFESLTSLLFLMTFPLTVLLWLSTIHKSLTENDVIMLITAVLATAGVLLNAFVTNATLSFSSIKKLIMFIMTLLFLQTAYRIRIRKEEESFINRVADFLILFLVGMYILRPAQMHTIQGIPTRYLTFRFSNPNLTAMFLTCLYILKTQRLFVRTTWYRKLYHIATSVLLAWFILETQARNCLLVAVMYTAAIFWLMFRGWGGMRIGRLWAALVAWLPALFVAAYVSLIYQPWVQKLLSFLVSEGKGLDSRMIMWEPALQALKRYPLTGAYFVISNGTGSAQMHNSHLDIATSYGIITLVLVCLLLMRYLHQKGRRYREKRQFAHILAFACAIMMGLGEAAVFSGGMGIYILAGAFLVMSNDRVADKNGSSERHRSNEMLFLRR